jgi:hypothetical protein
MTDTNARAVRIPMRTGNGLNDRLHHFARARKVKEARGNARMVVMQRARNWTLPCTITLTREGPGTLDDDNLPGALKAIRDGIADAFGTDDRTPKIQWKYDQVRTREWGVLVEWEPRGE